MFKMCCWNFGHSVITISGTLLQNELTELFVFDPNVHFVLYKQNVVLTQHNRHSPSKSSWENEISFHMLLNITQLFVSGVYKDEAIRLNLSYSQPDHPPDFLDESSRFPCIFKGLLMKIPWMRIARKDTRNEKYGEIRFFRNHLVWKGDCTNNH